MGVPLGFDVVEEISGPQNSFLNHIIRETQTAVLLIGKGSGLHEDVVSTLHVYIGATTSHKVQEAMTLIENLLSSVRAKCASFIPSLDSVMQHGTKTGLKLGTKLTADLHDRGWKQELDLLERLKGKMQTHENQLVQDGLDSKFLESSAAVFGQFQDLCRQSALREQDTQRKLVKLQALVAAFVPTVVQKALQNGMTPSHALTFTQSIVEEINQAADAVPPPQQPPIPPHPGVKRPPPPPNAGNSQRPRY